MTPLLLLPGLMCDAAVRAPQMAALGRSATVVAYGDADSIGAKQPRALLDRPDASPELAHIACPTLLFTGSHDAWSNVAQHDAMRARIAGATLVVVPGCDHMTTLEDPAAVTAALAAWLLA